MMVPTVPCHYLVQLGLITQPWNLHGPWSTQQVMAVKFMYSYWLQVALNVASNRKLKEIIVLFKVAMVVQLFAYSWTLKRTG